SSMVSSRYATPTERTSAARRSSGSSHAHRTTEGMAAGNAKGAAAALTARSPASRGHAAATSSGRTPRRSEAAIRLIGFVRFIMASRPVYGMELARMQTDLVQQSLYLHVLLARQQ